MTNSIKSRTAILALILFVFAIGYTFAANKVVVIPLGADAAQQSFAVFAGGNQSLVIPTLITIVRVVTIEAPSDGVVIVNSTAQVVEDIGGDGVHCSITKGTGMDYSYQQRWRSPGDSTSNSQLSGTRGFNVSAGVVYNFRLVCGHIGTASNSSNMYDSSLTAIFTPSA